MAIESYFFNAVETGGVYDRTYNAEQFCSWRDQIVGNGVFADPSDNLQVMADSDMNVVVKAGEAWIYGHKMVADADEHLTLSAADVALDRIDSVVVYCDWNNREMGINVIEGTPASSPVPKPVNQSRGVYYELRLANIYVTHQATSISQANITDTRGWSECGYVAGLIDQLDTETLFTQWQTAFDEWFEGVQQTVWDANFIQKLENTWHIPVGTVSIDIETSYVSSFVYGTDIFDVYFNGMRLVPTNDYTVSRSGGHTIVTFVNPPSAYVDCTVVVYKPRQLS